MNQSTWSISLGHFIKHKHLISEEWCNCIFKWSITCIKTSWFIWWLRCFDHSLKVKTLFRNLLLQHWNIMIIHFKSLFWPQFIFSFPLLSIIGKKITTMSLIFFMYSLVVLLWHSSEIRGLRSTKCSSETFQNLLYFMYKKTHVVCSFFGFHFVQLYFFT